MYLRHRTSRLAKTHCRQVGDKAKHGARCLSLAVDKRHFAAVGCVKCHFALKCVGLALGKGRTALRHKVRLYFRLRCLALVQKAICRFHRQGSATWVKVLDISCSIYDLPSKPAVRNRFRLKT